MTGFSAPQGKTKVARSKGPPAYRSPGRTLRRPEPLRRAFSGTEGLNPSSSSGESNELRNRGGRRNPPLDAAVPTVRIHLSPAGSQKANRAAPGDLGH